MLKNGVTGILFLGLLGLFSVANAADDPGKKIFLDQKCNKCHEIKSLSIAKLPKEAEAGEEAEAEEEADTLEAPDLKAVATDDQVQKAAGGASQYLKDYLQKKVDHTGGEGANKKPRKHKKLFKGADADLTALVNFLLTVK